MHAINVVIISHPLRHKIIWYGSFLYEFFVYNDGIRLSSNKFCCKPKVMIHREENVYYNLRVHRRNRINNMLFRYFIRIYIRTNKWRFEIKCWDIEVLGKHTLSTVVFFFFFLSNAGFDLAISGNITKPRLVHLA